MKKIILILILVSSGFFIWTDFGPSQEFNYEGLKFVTPRGWKIQHVEDNDSNQKFLMLSPLHFNLHQDVVSVRISNCNRVTSLEFERDRLVKVSNYSGLSIQSVNGRAWLFFEIHQRETVTPGAFLVTQPNQRCLSVLSDADEAKDSERNLKFVLENSSLP